MGVLRNTFRNIVTYPKLTDWVTRLLSPSVTIFMLHRFAVAERGVNGISPDYLRRCLSYLRQHNYRFIAIEEAVQRILANNLPPAKWVAFSLDDGFEEQVRIGASLFHEFACPVTCFLVTDFIDGKGWPWDYKLMYLARKASRQTIEITIEGTRHTIEMGTADTESFLLRFGRRFAPESLADIVASIADRTGVDLPDTPPIEMQPSNWDAVRKAEQMGMQFGPHSANHFILSRTNDATLQDQIARSAQRIRQECAQPANVFCYPSGKVNEFDRRAIAAVRDQGLACGVSAEPGYLEQHLAQQHSGYRFALPRLPLPEKFKEFELYVSWAQRLREHTINSPLRQFYDA